MGEKRDDQIAEPGPDPGIQWPDDPADEYVPDAKDPPSGLRASVERSWFTSGWLERWPVRWGLVIGLVFAVITGVRAYNEARTGSDPDETVVESVEQELGRTLTDQELVALHGQVVALDALTTCDEFWPALIAEATTPEDTFVLGVGVGAYSEGSAVWLMEECSGQLAVDLQARNRGDDATLDTLWDQCESGDFESCDLLYVSSPNEGGYVTFAASCGDRSPGETDWCIAALGDGLSTERWREECRAGNNGACDLLFQFSEAGSDDQLLGMSCGGTAAESDLGCIMRFGP